MKILKIEIKLKNSHGVYCGDDEVKGNLLVYCARPARARSIKGISIELKGEAEVSWEESNGRTKIVHYNKERYFYKKILLYQADRKNPLQQCEHKYDFEFRLPHALPGSYEGMFGHLRYIVRATIERRWLPNVNTSMNIQVHSPLDLKKCPKLSLPVEATRKHQFWCMWCISKPVIVSLHLTQAYLIPGKELNPSVRVANHSHVNIEAINLQLVRLTTYYDSISRGAMKCTEALLAHKTFQGEVRSGVIRTWRREIFPIPEFHFINLTGCSIIKQTFYLRLRISLPWPHLNFTMRLPMAVSSVSPH